MILWLGDGQKKNLKSYDMTHCFLNLDPGSISHENQHNYFNNWFFKLFEV